MSINISPGVVDDLLVYPDSDIDKLVDDFAIKHHLGKLERDKIFKELSAAVEAEED